MLDRPRPRSRTPSAARQRRSRARRKRGLVLLPVEVDEHQLVEALILSMRISEADGLDRRRLAEEAAAILEDFIGRFDET
jgi:hypothetical protein